MFERFLSNTIAEMSELFPAIYLAGPRQAGKSTLVKNLKPTRNYLTMDNLQILNSAKQNPQEFVKICKKPCIFDEIQRCPELLLPIKESIDASTQKGQFILTGSANILTMPQASDSLAGRMAIFELLPLSVQEILNNQKNWIEKLFQSPTPEIFSKKSELSFTDICQLAITGGYPDVYKASSKKFKNTWFESYSKTMLERDLREISDYKSVTRTNRLFQLLGLRSSSVVNVMDLARSSDIPASSISIYLNALESLFLIKRIPGYFGNLNSRLTKAPKIYLIDSGLMCHLVNIESTNQPWEHREWGQVFETFVFNEIRKQLTWSNSNINMYHYRTNHGKEIDLILENKQQEIVAVEIKASQNVSAHMGKNFSHLKSDLKERFKIGIVIYTGDSIEILEENVYAIPFSYIV